MTLTTDIGTAERAEAPFPETMEPGIYFNLPETDYHADPSLSSSGMKDILLSPLAHWCRSPHLNPNYEEKETDATIWGSAFDVRVTMGRAAFEAAYAVAPAKADFPDAIDGAAALRVKCEDLGLKKSGSIAEMCERIIEAEPGAELWPIIQAEWEAENASREKLSRAWADDIEFRAGLIEKHPDAKRAFQGGYPQVSIFWRDEETGCPLKARADYLKPTAVVDLKSFANMNDAPPLVAFIRNVVQYRYDVQAVHYKLAATVAKDLPAYGEVDEVWLQQFRTAEPPAFYFVAMQKGDVPNLLVREFGPTVEGQQQDYFTGAWMARKRAIAEYCLCLETFGTAPWSPPDQAKPLIDTDFPLYHMERNVA